MRRLLLAGLAASFLLVFADGDPPFELLRKIGVRFGGDATPARSLSARP